MLKPSFVPSGWDEKIALWMRPWHYDQISLLIAYPGSDWNRRMRQMRERVCHNNKREMGRWRISDYRVDKWGSSEAIREWVGAGKKVVVAGLERMLGDHRIDLIKTLQDLYREDGRQVMLIAESNVWAVELARLWDGLGGFTPRVSYLSMYSVADTKLFVEYLGKRWSMQADKMRDTKIAHWSGGNLAIAKEIVWSMLEHNEEVGGQHSWLDLPAVLRQATLFWRGLNEEERVWLVAQVYGRALPSVDPTTQEYLQRINLLADDGTIACPWLSEYVKRYVHDPMGLEIAGESVVIASQNYTHYFSKRQREWMRELLASKGSTISRERLMEIGWGEYGASDWALDSQLARLRKLLDQIGVGSKHLVTLRGRGVAWH